MWLLSDYRARVFFTQRCMLKSIRSFTTINSNYYSISQAVTFLLDEFGITHSFKTSLKKLSIYSVELLYFS